MSNHVKIVIVNETEFNFAQTDEGSDFVMTTGTLAPGSGLPPPVLEPNAKCTFTVMTPLAELSPEGYLRYEFEFLKMRVFICWDDFTKVQPAKVVEEGGEKVVESPVNPFHFVWRLLDGGFGDLDAPPVKLTDDSGKEVTLNQLAEFHRRDKDMQAKKDKWKNPVEDFKTLTATFTLRVKNTEAAGPGPHGVCKVMPVNVVRPTGGAKAVIGKAYRTWDQDDLPQRRKKILAVIGNQFPQIYVAAGEKLSGVDPYRKVPYQRMTCWSPGNGTSCTSVNGMIEGILTPSSGKWAFTAHHFEEAYVPWGADPSRSRPNIGDIYLLYRDIVADKREKATDSPHLRHCGIIVHVPEKPGEDWITADGGQTVNVSGDAAFLNRRPWELRIPSQPNATKKSVWDKAMIGHPFARPIAETEYPYLGGGAESKGDLKDANRLIGWLDLEALAIQLKISEAFDAPLAEDRKIRQRATYSEYDYQFLGAWIDDLLGKRPGAVKPWIEHIEEPVKNPPPWNPPQP